MPRSRVPSYRLHKPTGQAVVTLPRPGGGRRDYYLGPWQSAISKKEYARLIGELAAAPVPSPRPTAGNDLTVAELLLGFWRHCEDTYKGADGKPTSALSNYKLALRPVRLLYGHCRAVDFGPVALRAVRDWHVRAGIIRPEVNRRIERVRLAFKWAVAEQLVPPTVLVALKAVDGLRKGRSPAPDRPPVRPVPEADARAVLPHVTPAVAAMVELQLLTGARPGEVCRLRPCDIDRSADVWVYRPETHKSDHLGKDRFVAIGPKAQQILARFAPPEPTDYYFSPARGAAERAARKGRRAAGRPGGRYPTGSYSRSVVRGCEKAGVEPWTPNRLRHTIATAVRKLHGLEAAQVALGHSRANTTEIYAEKNLDLAATVALAVG